MEQKTTKCCEAARPGAARSAWLAVRLELTTLLKAVPSEQWARTSHMKDTTTLPRGLEPKTARRRGGGVAEHGLAGHATPRAAPRPPQALPGPPEMGGRAGGLAGSLARRAARAI